MCVGAVAQLGEHLLCKQGVNGSIPFSSTISLKVIEANLLEVESPRRRTLILELVDPVYKRQALVFSALQ
jgi:hypothetical protein